MLLPVANQLQVLVTVQTEAQISHYYTVCVWYSDLCIKVSFQS